MHRLHLAVTLALLAAAAFAAPDYTGYSGAPGTSGTCAGSCHGSGTGAIQVAGFPAVYEPGQSYVVSVFKQSGSSISNFNASVRVGSGSQPAGTITAGYQTQTYALGIEPNGVHLSSNNQDSCTFNWQAPDSAVGDVKLYMAGHQGSMGGANTEIVLTASQAAGISQGRTVPPAAFSLRIEPTVASRLICVRMTVPPGYPAALRMTDRNGRLVARVSLPPTEQSERTLVWSPADSRGRRLATGVYFVTLCSRDRRLAGKFAIR